MPEEARDGRVQRERDAGVARQLAEALRERIAHPEPALAVDLAGRVAALPEKRDGLLGALPGGDARRPDANRNHGSTLAQPPGHGLPSGGVPTLFPCPSDLLASSFWSWISTSALPISGARRTTSPSGTSRSWPRSCAPPTA